MSKALRNDGHIFFTINSRELRDGFFTVLRGIAELSADRREYLINLGVEVYLERGVAFTFDLSGRARFERLEGGSPFGFVATVGVATGF